MAMPGIIEDVGKVFIGVVASAIVVMFMNWLNTPSKSDIEAMIEKKTHSLDDIRVLMEKESPWTRDKPLIMSRLEAGERAYASLSLRIDAILTKLDGMDSKVESEMRGLQSKLDIEMRGIQNSMIRIVAKLELMDDEVKKKSS